MAVEASTEKDGTNTATEFSLDKLFNLTRGTKTLSEKRLELAKMSVSTRLQPGEMAAKAILSERTGAKEVVGKINELTGLSGDELNLSKGTQTRLKQFMSRSNASVQTLWRLALEEAGQPAKTVPEPVEQED